ncbi:MAG TPA: TlpA disulfide reductase family protein [Terracidiphilus sp.]
MKASIAFVVMIMLGWLAPQARAKRAPNLELKDLSGKTTKLSDLHGSIAVINFWATWCGPCQEELPMLGKLKSEYTGKNVHFIAASADAAKNRAALDRFVAAHPIGMEIWVGADLDMLERAGLGNELPATLIVDEHGQVVARVLGEAREEDIRRPLDWLLGSRSSPAPQAVVKHY